MSPESFPGTQGQLFTLYELPDGTDPEGGLKGPVEDRFLLPVSLCRKTLAQPAKPVLGGRTR